MMQDRLEYLIEHIKGDARELAAEIALLQKELADWKENAKFLLDSTSRPVRSCYKFGEENLMESLIINYIALRDEAKRQSSS